MVNNTFKSLKDFNIHFDQVDKENFYKICSINLDTWRKLTHLLASNLDFSFSSIWEIYVSLDRSKFTDQEMQDLGYFFNLNWDKIWSRGLGYYGLFWEAYNIENRKNYKKFPKVVWDSFWTDYDKYITLLSKLKDKADESLYLVYLDNYRNFLLVWSYIFVILKKSNKRKNKAFPINNLVFADVIEDRIDKILENLINLYYLTLDNILHVSLLNDSSHLFMLPDLEKLYSQIKSLIDNDLVLKTKKRLTTIGDFFSNNSNNIFVWMEKLFRNIREEDNLWIILSFFLQKHFKLSDISSRKKIFNLIKQFREKQKTDYILSLMYWGIEFALVANYLGYNSWWLNYSVYHLKNKEVYKDINDLFYPLSKEKNLAKFSVALVDDNIDSWTTLDRTRTILNNNHISVKLLAVPRIKLSKVERSEIKGNINSDNWEDISNIKKHIALNSLYVLPRVNKKNRNINLLIERKLRKFRKLFWKEFRSL